MVLQNSYIFLYKDKTEKEKYQRKMITVLF